MTLSMLAARDDLDLTLGATVTAIVWVGDTAMLALGNGTVCVAGSSGDDRIIAVHDGAILAACRHPDGQSIATGGDDGCVYRVTADDGVHKLGSFGAKWVEHLVASEASGVLVAGVGRGAVVWGRNATEPSHRFTVGSSIGGLALDGKGKRLAVAHYNGATLFYVGNPTSGQTALNWVGSHLACTLSGTGDFLVTGVQETGLHGWKLPELLDMRMSGYRGKTRSFSWGRKDKILATSGDMQAIIWPFEGRTGPMGKAPTLVGGRDEGILVTHVAFQPRHDLLAIGYSDGAVTVCQIENDSAILLNEPAARITALAWNDAGNLLAWGDEDGHAGLVDVMAAR